MMRNIALLSVFSVLVLFSGTPMAQTFPDKTVRIIVPYTPGGGVDLIARLVAKKLGEKWTGGVIVENKPGGGTIIATRELAASPADGTTILLGTTVFSVNISLIPKLPYNTLKDFRGVALAATAPNVIVVNPSIKAHTLKELVAYAKANPKKLNYGYPGVGTASHLAGELFRIEAGIETVGLPYKGSRPMLTAILGGEIDYMFDLTGSLPYVRAGRLRALAVTSSKRLSSMPEIPTVGEAGLPGYEAITWYGFIARSGTPVEKIDVLNREINAALKSPEVHDKITTQGMEVLGSTPQEFDRFIRSEAQKWGKVVRESHITRQ